MKPSETTAQNALKVHKPLVYDKVIRHGMRIVRLEWSYLCNMRCKHCSIRELQGRSLRPQMTIDNVRSLADQAHELGFSQFVLTGGEPLMFGDFDELLRAIDPQRFWITTDTNGWYLNSERAQHLKTIGVDKVQISIDNLDPDMHDEFRQKPGAWERALDAIFHMKDAGLKILVQTVVDKQRVYSPELLEFIDYFNDMDIPVYIGYAKPVGAWRNRKDVMIDDHDIAYIERLTKNRRVFTHLTPSYDYPGGCIAMKRMINVTRYGDVNPCPFMQEISVGNLLTEPLSAIVERGMNRFGEHIPTCLMATDKDFVRNYAA